jgi:hypothetical protein
MLLPRSFSLRQPATIVSVALAVLGLKVLLGILVEYRWYFPPNFRESAFLTGREATFTAVYATAFYVHILVGPLTVLLGTFLLWNRGAGRWRAWHRWGGRVQMAFIFVALVPSGLVMATQALAGPIAGWGFALLSVATAITAALALWRVMRGQILLHQQWAFRCYLLLVSPLLFRLVAGVFIVTQSESELAYRLNAWLSWLVPLAVYEAWLRWPRVVALRTTSSKTAADLIPASEASS